MPVNFYCLGCKHYIAFGQCRAFDKEIPTDIWLGQNDHRKPYRGDNGIRFEPLPERKPPADKPKP